MKEVKFRRLLAGLLCALMVVTTAFAGNIMTARADDGTGSLHFDESQLAKATLSYKLGDADEVTVTGGNLNITGIPSGTVVVIKAVPLEGNNITEVQAHEGSMSGGPAYNGVPAGDSTNGFTYTFTANSNEYYIELREGSQGPQGPQGGKFIVNFAEGSWVVGEVAVSANKNGTLELEENDEITLTNFNAETMEVRVATADGFNTTLNVIDGKTKLANKTNEGGLPNALTFTVQAKGSGNGPTNPPGNPGGEPNIFVETNQPEMIGELKIDNRNVNWNENRTSGGVEVQDAPSYTVMVQLEFGKSASSITINGTKYTSESSNVTVDGPEGDRYTISNVVPNEESKFIISFEEAESTISTILWTYDVNDPTGPQGDTFSEDALVTHGKVEIVSIKRGDKVLYANGDYATGVNPEADKVMVEIEGQRGYIRLEKGDDIVIKLIPEYGYQLGSATINERELTPKSNNFSDVSTFTLNDVQGQMHFSGVFVEKDDTIANTSEAITSASITDGEKAAESGNLSLKVEDASADASALAEAQDKNTSSKLEAVATLNLTLDNIVSMGPGKGDWTKNITEFEKDITVGLDLSDISVGDGEELVVVRKHGDAYDVLAGVTFTEGTLYVPTNKFSTYSILKKSVDKKDDGKDDDKKDDDKKDDDKKDDDKQEDTQKEDTTNNIVVSTTGQKDNYGSGKLASSSKEILDSVLTAEDKAAIASGKKIDVWVTVKDITSTVPAAEKKLVEDKVPNNYNVGVYLDIDLLKQVEGSNSVKVKELPNGKIKISVSVPDTLKKEGRTYKVIRIHEGVATVLDATVNAAGELAFETDSFSTYTIIYTDEANTAIPSSPKTGDNSNLAKWLTLVLCGVALLGFVIVRNIRKKEY